MPAIVKVYPTKASALNIKHPHGPKMLAGGVTWPLDSFTGRRLRDGSVTKDESKAFKPESVAPSAPKASLPTPAAPAAPASSASGTPKPTPAA